MTPPDNAPTVPADRDALVAEVARLRKALAVIEELAGQLRNPRLRTDAISSIEQVARAALADAAPRGGGGEGV